MPALTRDAESVHAFDPDVDPRAVRFTTEGGQTWWLSPPMDGGPRFLREETPEGSPALLAIDLMREEGDEPQSWPFAVGQALFARVKREDIGSFLLVTARITSIEVLGRPIHFRRPGDA